VTATALLSLASRDAFMAKGHRPHELLDSDPLFPNVSFAEVSADELAAASTAPRVIVPELLYADVALLYASGGTGKTTLVLYQAVIMALGRPLWGRKSTKPLNTTIVTREDRRERLVGLLREIMRAMHLTAEEVGEVLRRVFIIDLTGVPFRLSCVIDDVVMPHQVNIWALIEKLVEYCAPDVLVFDPMVSFGVGESRVNDAEHGLIEAMRIFRNFLGCCVLGVHHTGKANARDKSLDQYSGRGGSAFSDGARMVAVMQPLEAAEWEHETCARLEPGESGIVMAIPKLSYCPPQDPIFIRRKGYAFTHETVVKRTRDQVSAAVAEQVLQFLTNEKSQGRTYAQRDLEAVASDINLKRAEIRAGTARLKAEGRLVESGKPRTASFHLAPTNLEKSCAESCAENPEK
jgi:regulatory protein RepA